MGAPETLYVAPHSTESEQSVLGGLMLDNLSYDRIAGLLREQDFYRSDHRIIFRAITKLIDSGKRADIITVNEALGNKSEECGGLAYLNALTSSTPSAAGIKGYAQIVRDRAVLRGLQSIGQDAIDSAANRGGRSTEEIVSSIEERIYALAQEGALEDDELPAIGDLLPGVRDRIQETIETGKPKLGMLTGLRDLDRKLLGMNKGDLIIIGGRPSMGKSTLGYQIAKYRGIKRDKVLIHSFEATKESIANRQLANEAQVSLSDIRTGEIDDAAISRLSAAQETLEQASIFIDDRPALTVAQVRARARRTKRKHGLDLIIIDHIGLMRGIGDNRTQEIGSISRGLKAIAKEFDVPVIALAQLNRGVESQTDKRPKLSDLRESGDIEQDADVVILLYRDEYYYEDSMNKGIAELLVAKQRDGATGKVYASFRGECTRFDDLANGFFPATPTKKTTKGFSDD